MSISPISASSPVATSSLQGGVQQRRSELRQLAQALQSADLSAAQSAFSSLTQNSTSQPSQANASSVVAQDFAAVGKAIQSGDLSGAQEAFTKLQKDAVATSSGLAQAQGASRGHQHHLHVHSDAPASDGSTTGRNIDASG